LYSIEHEAKVHTDFVGIYPFIDENGYSPRLLMNLELMQIGCPSCLIN